MNIEVHLYKAHKELMMFYLNYPVVPRIGEVIWMNYGKVGEEALEKFGQTYFTVIGVFYYFCDNGDGVYIEAEPFNPK